MTGKKWLLISCFAIALVIGMALIIPPDVFDAGSAGDQDDFTQYPDNIIIDGNEIEFDEDASYYVFTNDTYQEEPVYVSSDAGYEIALFHTESEVSNETLYVKDDGSYTAINEEPDIPDNTTSNATEEPADDYDGDSDVGSAPDASDVVDDSSSMTDSDDDGVTRWGLIPKSLDDENFIETSEADGSGSANVWIMQSIAYIVICAVLFSLFFARLSSEDIMGGVRKDIYDFISQNPGEHLASITKEFNMSSSSARHHLYVLETSEKIVSHKPGKYKHYYVNKNGFSRYTSGSEYKAVISALKNDTSRNIVKILAQGVDMNQQMISQQMGIHASTVNWHAKRLMAANVIRKSRRGKDIIYSLNDEIDVERMVAIIEGTSS